MLIIKGDSVLDVTPKAYEVIYKDHGYTVQAEDVPETPKAPPKRKPKAGE
jgi:hypothetical protein